MSETIQVKELQAMVAERDNAITALRARVANLQQHAADKDRLIQTLCDRFTWYLDETLSTEAQKEPHKEASDVDWRVAYREQQALVERLQEENARLRELGAEEKRWYERAQQAEGKLRRLAAVLVEG